MANVKELKVPTTRFSGIVPDSKVTFFMCDGNYDNVNDIAVGDMFCMQETRNTYYAENILTGKTADCEVTTIKDDEEGVFVTFKVIAVHESPFYFDYNI